MSALSRLLSRIRRDGDHAATIGSEYVGLSHSAAYALLAIIEDQQAALMRCRDAGPFAKRHAVIALARVEELAAKVCL